MTNYQRTYSIGEVEVDGARDLPHDGAAASAATTTRSSAARATIAGFDTLARRLRRRAQRPARGAVPRRGAATGSVAHGWNPIGSHQVTCGSSPGASETFALRARLRPRTPAGARRAAAGPSCSTRYSATGAVDGAFAPLRRVLGRAALGASRSSAPTSTSTAHAQHLEPVPVHGDVQPRPARRSLFETGIGRGMGFRDSNQDLLGFVHLVPERARQRSSTSPRRSSPTAPASTSTSR